MGADGTASADPLLRRRLDALADSFGPEHLTPDPLEVVRRYRDPADLEVAGLVAAGLAFGGARVIVGSVRRALEPLGERPADALAATGDALLRRALRGFRHRWVGGADVAALLSAVRTLRREHGSLEAGFVAGDPGGPDVGGAMAAFAARLVAADPGRAPRGAAAFFPSPERGSACKRPALFLRWMVRRGGVDTGAWPGVDPARLVLPLDTHVGRIARALGLIRRPRDDWRAALEGTASLRRFDPADPVRYDYALCRLGILDLCPRQRDDGNCRRCALYDVCAYGASGHRPARRTTAPPRSAARA